jgi:hypothetical protein
MTAPDGSSAKTLWSTETKVFLCSILLHLTVQLLLSMLLPFPNFSELSGHDGSVYYSISYDPFPSTPAFTLKRYQRPLLPLVVWGVFSWNRHLGFILVNCIAVSFATVYFYRISKTKSTASIQLTVLFAIVPYLFAGVHLGLTEPLMMAGLLAGFYYARRDDALKAACGYAIAILAKEAALFPLLAELVLQTRRGCVRRSLLLALSFVPVAGWYLPLGVRWKDPLWFLKGTEGQLGFAPWVMADLIRNSQSIDMASRAFMILNQIANGLLLVLILVGMYQLRSKLSVLFWVAFSAAPLLVLGRPIYSNNFDLGRQALPAFLLLLALGGFPRVLRGKLYWLAAALGLWGSAFWTLYFARFFVHY